MASCSYFQLSCFVTEKTGIVFLELTCISMHVLWLSAHPVLKNVDGPT